MDTRKHTSINMEVYLERIAENTRTKTDINLLVSGNTDTITTTYNSPIMLDLKQKYDIALTSLET